MTSAIRRSGLGAMLAMGLFLTACSGSGGGDLVTTDLSLAKINGATTTIVAPPGWEEPAHDNGSNGGGANLADLTVESAGNFCTSSTCDVDSREINHPSWGPVKIFAMRQHRGAQMQQLAAVDAKGVVKWTYNPGAALDGWEGFVTDSPDESGALFVTYMPGRYFMTIVLRPDSTGFEGLPNGGDSTSDERVFLNSGVVEGLDSDGNYEIKEVGATPSVLKWTGSGYQRTGPSQAPRDNRAPHPSRTTSTTTRTTGERTTTPRPTHDTGACQAAGAAFYC